MVWYFVNDWKQIWLNTPCKIHVTFETRKLEVGIGRQHMYLLFSKLQMTHNICNLLLSIFHSKTALLKIRFWSDQRNEQCITWFQNSKVKYIFGTIFKINTYVLCNFVIFMGVALCLRPKNIFLASVFQCVFGLSYIWLSKGLLLVIHKIRKTNPIYKGLTNKW